MQDTDLFLDKISCIENAQGLYELGAELLQAWGLSSFEVAMQDGDLPHILARVGEPLHHPEGDGEHSAGVAESDGVWEFALGHGDTPHGWLRVKIPGAPKVELIQNLERLTKWLRPAVGRLAERERMRLLEHQIEMLREQAQQAERLKDEFLSNLSHELRTPLTAILGFSEILMDRNGLPPQHSECIGRIHQNGERLLKLLNRLIQLAKIESDRLQVNLMFVNPTELLSECRSKVQAAAMAKGLHFEVQNDDLPNLYLDPRLFLEALVCVIENAIKFTEQGSVSVRSWADLTRLFVEVKDTGRGIQEAHLPFIFDAFWQGDGSLTRAVGGNGIGLTLANRLIHRMGGEISVESVPGQGSTIRLSMPLESPVSRDHRRHHDKALEQFGLPFERHAAATAGKNS